MSNRERAGLMRAPVLALLALAMAFAGLGVWQVKRLAWKTRLIAQTEQAVHAPAIDVAALPAGDLAPLAYRHVAMTGHFLPKGTTLVTGTSVLGTGYWELVPLASETPLDSPSRQGGGAEAKPRVDSGRSTPPRTSRPGPPPPGGGLLEDGRIVMINRGFLPEGSKVDAARRAVPTGVVHVDGLLRPTEPGGTWLRANRPAQDRWYSRDVAAIAARRGVTVDPRLFIDSGTPATDGPVAGLTIIAFPNSHLAYALTWFTMGMMALGGAIVIHRRG
jgi:surfeit locus 1 family protein